MAERGGQLGQGAVEHAGGLEEAPRAGVPALDDVEEALGRELVPRQWPSGSAASHSSSSPPGRKRADEYRGLEREWESERVRRAGAPGAPRRRVDQPAAVGRRRVSRDSGPCRARSEAPVPELQQLRCGERRDEDDEQQRGVEVVVEDAGLEADGGEDEPDLASGQHAEADEQLVAGCAEGADRRDELADDGDEQEHPCVAQHLGPPERAMSASMPICRKNTGMKRWPTGASSRRMRSDCSALAERDAGDEGADDRCELGGVGQLARRRG